MTEPMTLKQWSRYFRNTVTGIHMTPGEARACADAIDAAIKSRDAAVPVAWRADWPNWRQYHDADDNPLPESWDSPPPTITPLYTAPPAQPVSVPDAHELWAAAQLVPGEGIEDGVARITSLLAAVPRPAQPVSVPDGWVLVPAMATENMRAAGGSAYEHTCEESTWDDAENIYKAMLAAVPQPPVQEKDHE